MPTPCTKSKAWGSCSPLTPIPRQAGKPYDVWKHLLLPSSCSSLEVPMHHQHTQQLHCPGDTCSTAVDQAAEATVVTRTDAHCPGQGDWAKHDTSSPGSTRHLPVLHTSCQHHSWFSRSTVLDPDGNTQTLQRAQHCRNQPRALKRNRHHRATRTELRTRPGQPHHRPRSTPPTREHSGTA